jgi:glycerol uptake facilitator-like aquaporin
MPNSLAPKLVAEFMATFALVFIGAGTWVHVALSRWPATRRR